MSCCEKVEQKLSRLKRKIEEIERNVLHTIFSRDPKLFYQELCANHQKKLLELKNKKRILNQEQYDLLFPSNQQTNSEQFDTTLLGILLRSICGFKTNGIMFFFYYYLSFLRAPQFQLDEFIPVK